MYTDSIHGQLPDAASGCRETPVTWASRFWLVICQAALARFESLSGVLIITSNVVVSGHSRNRLLYRSPPIRGGCLQSRGVRDVYYVVTTIPAPTAGHYDQGKSALDAN